MDEAEWKTRKLRIDPKLDAAGWPRALPSGSAWSATGPAKGTAHRREEDPTDNGPADYTLCDGPARLAVVEAKRASTGVQEVMTQAERYSRGATANAYGYGKYFVPFLYATNGERIWFRDVRDPLNLQRTLRAFHTPDGLRELLAHDIAAEAEKLVDVPFTHAKLRDYQQRANEAIEAAIRARKRRILVAMATGTGKTFTMVHQVARLLQHKVARRVLFLVDRRALAVQAVRAFRSFDVENGVGKFHQVWNVFSQAMRKDDFDDDDGGSFDPEVLQSSDLEHPKPNATFVYVCTIQRMARHVLGQSAFSSGDDEEQDAGKLDIPIHAFDVVIADECHRGYSAHEQGAFRDTLEHFDAVQIGLTATPAQHTVQMFGEPVFHYGTDAAVEAGYLVDYDAVKIRSNVRVEGMFLKEGEVVDLFDVDREKKTLTTLEDQRTFDAEQVQREELVTSPDSTKKIALEVKKYADEHEQRTGRFPKTLIFAAHDIPKISHADRVAQTFREVLGRGNEFVAKITGAKDVDRPLQRIKEFRNRPSPGVVVTVDMLSTGVDIPDLEFLVFLRVVRSRILFVQMLGRGTRRGDKFPDKSRFVVFDCFDGGLFRYFKNATEETPAEPTAPTKTIAEVVEDIWQNVDREHNVGVLVKRLLRVDKEMAPESRDEFAALGVPNGDVATFARSLRKRIADEFVPTMTMLRQKPFLDLCVTFKRPRRTFLFASSVVDTVTSEWIVRGPDGAEYKPADYLDAFVAFVEKHRTDLEAVKILTGRPRDWSPKALTELKDAMAQANPRFTVDNLQTAFKLTHKKALVELLSMVQRAADEQHPLLTAEERVAAAFDTLTRGRTFTDDQRVWLDRIRAHLVPNLSIDEDDFDLAGLAELGGIGRAKKVFGASFASLLRDINEAVARV